jgi:hypothetical protein
MYGICFGFVGLCGCCNIVLKDRRLLYDTIRRVFDLFWYYDYYKVNTEKNY